jgi:hypothetical protein
MVSSQGSQWGKVHATSIWLGPSIQALKISIQIGLCPDSAHTAPSGHTAILS